MKFLYLSILFALFVSCNDNEIKVPVNDNEGLHEIWDNSRIYVLFKQKDGDTIADLKLGQTITTTHWLTAIDRRLKMKHLTQTLKKILKKRHKKSIHSKEGVHAYFTYLDTVQNKISFIDFDSIQIMPDYYTSLTYFNEYSKADNNTQKFHIIIYPDQILLNDSINLSNLPKKKLQDSLWKIISRKTTKQTNLLYLNFDQEIFFDRFLNYYTYFKNNPVPHGKLSPKIFIFTH